MSRLVCALVAITAAVLVSSCSFPSQTRNRNGPPDAKQLYEFDYVLKEGPQKGKTVHCLGYDNAAPGIACDFPHAH